MVDPRAVTSKVASFAAVGDSSVWVAKTFVTAKSEAYFI